MFEREACDAELGDKHDSKDHHEQEGQQQCELDDRLAALAPHRPSARTSRPHHRLSWSIPRRQNGIQDRKSTRLNSSHVKISYAVFCLKKKMEDAFNEFRFMRLSAG